MRCKHCLTTTSYQWWWLRGYFGVSGAFCTACFDLVEHRSNVPLNPQGFEQVKQVLDNRES